MAEADLDYEVTTYVSSMKRDIDVLYGEEVAEEVVRQFNLVTEQDPCGMETIFNATCSGTWLSASSTRGFRHMCREHFGTNGFNSKCATSVNSRCTLQGKCIERLRKIVLRAHGC